MTETPSETDGEERRATDHLDGLADGCGCAEVWEHLSERRESDAADQDDGTESSASGS